MASESIERELIESLLKNGIFFRQMFQYEEAEQTFRVILKRLKNCPNDDPYIMNLKAESLFHLAGVQKDLEQISNRTEALENFTQAYNIFFKLKEFGRCVDCLQMVGLCYRLLNQWDKALDYYNKALKLNYKGFKDKRRKGNLKRDIGIVLLDKKDFVESKKHLLTSLRLLKEVGNSVEIGITLEKLGRLFIYTHEIKKAENALTKANKLIRTIDSPLFKMMVYIDLSNLFLLKTDVKEAIRYFTLAWEIYEFLPCFPLQKKKLMKTSQLIDSLRSQVITQLGSLKALILGSCRGKGKELLDKISECIPDFVDSIILDDVPNKFGESIENKVRRLASEPNVFIIVEASTPSGAIDEIAIIAPMSVCARLRKSGKLDTFMQQSYSFQYRWFQDFKYKNVTELKKIIPEIVNWATDKLVEKALIGTRIFPWQNRFLEKKQIIYE